MNHFFIFLFYFVCINYLMFQLNTFSNIRIYSCNSIFKSFEYNQILVQLIQIYFRCTIVLECIDFWKKWQEIIKCLIIIIKSNNNRILISLNNDFTLWFFCNISLNFFWSINLSLLISTVIKALLKAEKLVDSNFDIKARLKFTVGTKNQLKIKN